MSGVNRKKINRVGKKLRIYDSHIIRSLMAALSDPTDECNSTTNQDQMETARNIKKSGKKGCVQKTDSPKECSSKLVNTCKMLPNNRLTSKANLNKKRTMSRRVPTKRKEKGRKSNKLIKEDNDLTKAIKEEQIDGGKLQHVDLPNNNIGNADGNLCDGEMLDGVIYPPVSKEYSESKDTVFTVIHSLRSAEQGDQSTSTGSLVGPPANETKAVTSGSSSRKMVKEQKDRGHAVSMRQRNLLLSRRLLLEQVKELERELNFEGVNLQQDDIIEISDDNSCTTINKSPISISDDDSTSEVYESGKDNLVLSQSSHTPRNIDSSVISQSAEVENILKNQRIVDKGLTILNRRNYKGEGTKIVSSSVPLGKRYGASSSTSANDFLEPAKKMRQTGDHFATNPIIHLPTEPIIEIESNVSNQELDSDNSDTHSFIEELELMPHLCTANIQNESISNEAKKSLKMDDSCSLLDSEDSELNRTVKVPDDLMFNRKPCSLRSLRRIKCEPEEIYKSHLRSSTPVSSNKSARKRCSNLNTIPNSYQSSCSQSEYENDATKCPLCTSPRSRKRKNVKCPHKKNPETEVTFLNNLTTKKTQKRLTHILSEPLENDLLNVDSSKIIIKSENDSLSEDDKYDDKKSSYQASSAKPLRRRKSTTLTENDSLVLRRSTRKLSQNSSDSSTNKTSSNDLLPKAQITRNSSRLKAIKKEILNTTGTPQVAEEEISLASELKGKNKNQRKSRSHPDKSVNSIATSEQEVSQKLYEEIPIKEEIIENELNDIILTEDITFQKQEDLIDLNVSSDTLEYCRDKYETLCSEPKESDEEKKEITKLDLALEDILSTNLEHFTPIQSKDLCENKLYTKEINKESDDGISDTKCTSNTNNSYLEKSSKVLSCEKESAKSGMEKCFLPVLEDIQHLKHNQNEISPLETGGKLFNDCPSSESEQKIFDDNEEPCGRKDLKVDTEKGKESISEEVIAGSNREQLKVVKDDNRSDETCEKNAFGTVRDDGLNQNLRKCDKERDSLSSYKKLSEQSDDTLNNTNLEEVDSIKLDSNLFGSGSNQTNVFQKEKHFLEMEVLNSNTSCQENECFEVSGSNGSIKGNENCGKEGSILLRQRKGDVSSSCEVLGSSLCNEEMVNSTVSSQEKECLESIGSTTNLESVLFQGKTFQAKYDSPDKSCITNNELIVSSTSSIVNATSGSFSLNGDDSNASSQENPSSSNLTKDYIASSDVNVNSLDNETATQKQMEDFPMLNQQNTDLVSLNQENVFTKKEGSTLSFSHQEIVSSKEGSISSVQKTKLTTENLKSEKNYCTVSNDGNKNLCNQGKKVIDNKESITSCQLKKDILTSRRIEQTLEKNGSSIWDLLTIESNHLNQEKLQSEIKDLAPSLSDEDKVSHKKSGSPNQGTKDTVVNRHEPKCSEKKGSSSPNLSSNEKLSSQADNSSILNKDPQNSFKQEQESANSDNLSASSQEEKALSISKKLKEISKNKTISPDVKKDLPTSRRERKTSEKSNSKTVAPIKGATRSQSKKKENSDNETSGISNQDKKDLSTSKKVKDKSGKADSSSPDQQTAAVENSLNAEIRGSLTSSHQENVTLRKKRSSISKKETQDLILSCREKDSKDSSSNRLKKDRLTSSKVKLTSENKGSSTFTQKTSNLDVADKDNSTKYTTIDSREKKYSSILDQKTKRTEISNKDKVSLRKRDSSTDVTKGKIIDSQDTKCPEKKDLSKDRKEKNISKTNAFSVSKDISASSCTVGKINIETEKLITSKVKKDLVNSRKVKEISEKKDSSIHNLQKKSSESYHTNEITSRIVNPSRKDPHTNLSSNSCNVGKYLEEKIKKGMHNSSILSQESFISDKKVSSPESIIKIDPPGKRLIASKDESAGSIDVHSPVRNISLKSELNSSIQNSGKDKELSFSVASNKPSSKDSPREEHITTILGEQFKNNTKSNGNKRNEHLQDSSLSTKYSEKQTCKMNYNDNIDESKSEFSACGNIKITKTPLGKDCLKIDDKVKSSSLDNLRNHHVNSENIVKTISVNSSKSNNSSAVETIECINSKDQSNEVIKECNQRPNKLILNSSNIATSPDKQKLEIKKEIPWRLKSIESFTPNICKINSNKFPSSSAQESNKNSIFNSDCKEYSSLDPRLMHENIKISVSPTTPKISPAGKQQGGNHPVTRSVEVCRNIVSAMGMRPLEPQRINTISHSNNNEPLEKIGFKIDIVQINGVKMYRFGSSWRKYKEFNRDTILPVKKNLESSIQMSSSSENLSECDVRIEDESAQTKKQIDVEEFFQPYCCNLLKYNNCQRNRCSFLHEFDSSVLRASDFGEVWTQIEKLFNKTEGYIIGLDVFKAITDWLGSQGKRNKLLDLGQYLASLNLEKVQKGYLNACWSSLIAGYRQTGVDRISAAQNILQHLVHHSPPFPVKMLQDIIEYIGLFECDVADVWPVVQVFINTPHFCLPVSFFERMITNIIKRKIPISPPLSHILIDFTKQFTNLAIDDLKNVNVGLVDEFASYLLMYKLYTLDLSLQSLIKQVKKLKENDCPSNQVPCLSQPVKLIPNDSISSLQFQQSNVACNNQLQNSVVHTDKLYLSSNNHSFKETQNNGYMWKQGNNFSERESRISYNSNFYRENNYFCSIDDRSWNQNKARRPSLNECSFKSNAFDRDKKDVSSLEFEQAQPRAGNISNFSNEAHGEHYQNQTSRGLDYNSMSGFNVNKTEPPWKQVGTSPKPDGNFQRQRFLQLPHHNNSNRILPPVDKTLPYKESKDVDTQRENESFQPTKSKQFFSSQKSKMLSLPFPRGTVNINQDNLNDIPIDNTKQSPQTDFSFTEFFNCKQISKPTNPVADSGKYALGTSAEEVKSISVNITPQKIKDIRTSILNLLENRNLEELFVVVKNWSGNREVLENLAFCMLEAFKSIESTNLYLIIRDFFNILSRYQESNPSVPRNRNFYCLFGTVAISPLMEAVSLGLWKSAFDIYNLLRGCGFSEFIDERFISKEDNLSQVCIAIAMCEMLINNKKYYEAALIIIDNKLLLDSEQWVLVGNEDDAEVVKEVTMLLLEGMCEDSSDNELLLNFLTHLIDSQKSLKTPINVMKSVGELMAVYHDSYPERTDLWLKKFYEYLKKFDELADLSELALRVLLIYFSRGRSRTAEEIFLLCLRQQIYPEIKYNSPYLPVSSCWEKEEMFFVLDKWFDAKAKFIKNGGRFVKNDFIVQYERADVNKCETLIRPKRLLNIRQEIEEVHQRFLQTLTSFTPPITFESVNLENGIIKLNSSNCQIIINKKVNNRK